MTLHERLNLPKLFKLLTLLRCLTCAQKDSTYADNIGLSIFGKTLLSYQTTEYFLTKYPRLPLNVLNGAVDLIIGTPSLSALAKSWGVEADSSSRIEKYLNSEPEAFSLGKLRFDNANEEVQPGLIKHSKGKLSEEEAMASAVKAVVGAYYASTKSIQQTNEFITSYILKARKLDIQSLFSFEQPTRELAFLCQREGLAPPVTRLLSESGRVSKRPVFLVGVFSGEEKLGENFGASLKEAKIRASVSALMNWYLYSPLKSVAPSEPGFEGVQEVDHGQVIV